MASQEQYEVNLRNDGNAVLNYSVRGRDLSGRLDIAGNQGEATLAPGERETVTLAIRLKKRPILGSFYYIPFEVEVNAGDEMPQVKSAVFGVEPIIPLWLVTLLPFVCLLALLPFLRLPVIFPGQTATVTPTAGATPSLTPPAEATATATATASPSPGPTTSPTPTFTPSATLSPSFTASPSATASRTAAPAASQTPTPAPSQTPTLAAAEATIGPLSLAVSVVWRLQDSGGDYAVASVVMTATGGDGQYTYYRDDIRQPGPRFEYYWNTCQDNPVSFRVDSGDGQTVRLVRYERAPCP